MADTRPHPILSYLRQVLGAPTGGLTDAELLRCFVAERDEAAFELLLWRHAAMVLHVCRQVLRDADAVEDAFQATFLVFVRKAGSIRRGELLGGWLHRVAYHVSLKASEQIVQRKKAEQERGNLDLFAAASAEADAGRCELRRMICEEVNRLPARYRTPIVACFFEGKTHEEVASQLGWPRGTVASRVARGRELLRRRLVHRGIVLTAAALTTALPVSSAPAALMRLIPLTMQMVKPMAASAVLSPRAANLAEGVLKAMYWTRVKIVMAVLLFAGLGGIGVTFWGTPPSAAELPGQRVPRAEAAADDAKAEQPKDADKLTRDMAQSRLNLRKLALAMHAYAKKNGHLPPPAIYDKKGRALLSWRVALLPYLDQNNLYKLFHLDEPWDSEHNKSLQEMVVKVYAPVGKPDLPRSRTFYQVFVSAAPAAKSGGGGAPPGSSGGAAGGAPAFDFITAAFVKGQKTRLPAGFPDGTANTILIVEAGNAVPWTKPEDLHYAADEPLPELGGLFPDIFQAAFASGDVAVFTKKYDETNLRFAITSNGAEIIDMEQILAPRRRRVKLPAERDEAAEQLAQKNDNLRHDLERARDNLRRLKAERALQREEGERNEKKGDPRLERLRRENARLQEELDRVLAESEALAQEIARRQKPIQRKGQ